MASLSTHPGFSRFAQANFALWFMIVPTAIFAYLVRDPVLIVVVSLIGVGLWYGRTKQIPATVDPQIRALQPLVGAAPILQIPVIFVAIGGSPVIIILITAFVLAAIRYHKEWIHALEPWWQFQQSIPGAFRKPLAFLIPGATGYYFGYNGGGREWTYTLLSLSVGIAIAFLLLFTPPDAYRRKIAA